MGWKLCSAALKQIISPVHKGILSDPFRGCLSLIQAHHGSFIEIHNGLSPNLLHRWTRCLIGNYKFSFWVCFRGGFLTKAQLGVISLAFSKISQLEIPAVAPPSRAHKTQGASLSCATLPWPLDRAGAVSADSRAVNMDVHRMTNHIQMDYNFDSMEPKHGKALPCQEDRFDSGLESLKDDELVNDFDDLKIDLHPHKHEFEPWRCEMTEDGDT